MCDTWLTPQQVSLLENIARAHDEWLSAGGRQPSVSVLQTVQEAVKGTWLLDALLLRLALVADRAALAARCTLKVYLAFIDLHVAGDWSGYDQEMLLWTPERRQNHRKSWREQLNGPDGWAETEPIFDSAIELCLWTIIS
jgi:hypothetical protein